MFYDNETHEILLLPQLEIALGKKFKVRVTPEDLIGTKYSVIKRIIPDCDYVLYIPDFNGFDRISEHEVSEKWAIRLKTIQELAIDTEMKALKVIGS